MNPLQPGDAFAGYTIERLLSEDGMREVYLARDPRLPHRDALTIFAAPLTDDDQFRARLDREAGLVSRLRHPVIAGISDRGESDGRLWIASEYIDGPDLAAVARSGPMPHEQVAQVIGQVADALDAAGALGLVHGTVAPATIRLAPGGHARLTGFGIAHAQPATDTALFSSPERLQQQATDTRSDQYSLACTAFLLLTGTAPYGATAEVARAHIHEPVPSISARRPGLPTALDAVFQRALAKNPADRYPSSREFAADLQRALSAPTQPPPPAAPPKRRSRKRLAIILGAIALVSVLIVAGGVYVVRTYINPPTVTASDDAADLTKDPVGTPLPSLDDKPSTVKWEFTVPGEDSDVPVPIGGTRDYALFTTGDYLADTTVLHIVDAETGKSVRDLTFPGPGGIGACENFQTPNTVVCRVDASTFATIDLTTGTVHRFTGPESGDISVTGDVVFIGNDEKTGSAYDITGRKLWSSSGRLDFMPPPGSPVVGQTDGTVFTVRDIKTGDAVYTRDTSKSVDGHHIVNFHWAPFLSGFAVKILGRDQVELFDAAGKRTAVAEEGWLPVEYSPSSHNGQPAATPLPVLVNEKGSRTATFHPGTGEPAVTVSLMYPAQFIKGAVGTRIVVSYRATSLEAPKVGKNGTAFQWFDAYEAKSGALSLGVPTVLGTDGTTIVVDDDDDRVKAYGPDSGTEAWTIRTRGEVVGGGGRVYDANRRVI
ncbi:protein kinase domain-containing protein [Gordonia phthalatica]|uniref:serine/threonine-protein kinase n=1 Tax=Gordonia phthalatica TaxID=1136941 RepID=UPI0007856C52|nr:serine/threonine-protein kinase [Gordonia phthalatica]